MKWILAFAGAAIIVLLLRCFAFTSFYLPAGNIDQSVYGGEGIIVNKWSYGLRTPLTSWFGYHRWKEKEVKDGDIVLFNNPANISRSLGFKEAFIGQCAGTPGDTLMMDMLFDIQNAEQLNAPSFTRYYRYPSESEERIDSLMAEYDINAPYCVEEDSVYNLRLFTNAEFQQLSKGLDCDTCIVPIEANMQPVKPLIVPGKDITVDIYPWNRTLMMNTILLHENKRAEIKNDTLFIDNQPADKYTFTKDYYWMTADKSSNLADSRLFGFVPQDHIIGKASFVWFSKDPEGSFFGGYRPDRFFKPVHQE